MAKLRLTNAMRDALVSHAQTLLTQLPEYKAFEALLEACLNNYRSLMTDHIEQHVPQKDMKVLEKWGCVYVVRDVDIRVEPWKDDVHRTDWRVKWVAGTARNNLPILRGGRKGDIAHQDRYIPILTNKGLWLPTTENEWHRVAAVEPDHVLFTLAKEIEDLYTKMWYFKKHKLSDYRKLMTSCRYFEEVCDVWPEALALATRFRGSTNASGNALIVLNSDVIMRIKADVAAREVA